MTQSYEGGCACGAVRYAIDGVPVFQNHCHCRDCQRRSGTGHGSYLTFSGRASMRLSGTPSVFRVTADSGEEKLHAFCPTCGSPVWLEFAAMPDLLAVHAASLDAPELFRPQAITYAVRAPDWDRDDPGVARFETMPAA